MDIVSVDFARHQLADSIAALVRHHRTCDPGRAEVELRTQLEQTQDTANRLLIEVWWVGLHSSVANALRWETLELCFGALSDVNEFLETVENETTDVRVRLTPQPLKYPPSRTEAPLPPLFQYHPERFRAAFPSAKKAAQLFERGTAPQLLLTELARTAIPAENERRFATPLRKNIESKDDRGFQRMLEVACFYGMYHQDGRQIFDIPHNLSAMFRQTDIDDIPVNLLKFPYPSFYLHFGPQPDLELAPGWLADGAYVQYHADAEIFQIMVTAAPADPRTYGVSGASDFEPTYFQSMKKELLGMGLGEAVEQVFAEKIQELKDQVGGTSPVNEGIVAFQEAFVARGGEVHDVSARNAAMEMAGIPKRHAAYKAMLRLVVNAIAYLSAYPEDSARRWPDNTPVNLRIQAETGTPKHRARAQSKLASLGFTPIHFAGQQFVRNAEESKSAVSGDRTVCTHWRRGHWRRQRYGPNRTFQKLAWLMPVLVNPKNTDADSPKGHIYLVT